MWGSASSLLEKNSQPVNELLGGETHNAMALSTMCALPGGNGAREELTFPSVWQGN